MLVRNHCEWPLVHSSKEDYINYQLHQCVLIQIKIFEISMKQKQRLTILQLLQQLSICTWLKSLLKRYLVKKTIWPFLSVYRLSVVVVGWCLFFYVYRFVINPAFFLSFEILHICYVESFASGYVVVLTRWWRPYGYQYIAYIDFIWTLDFVCLVSSHTSCTFYITFLELPRNVCKSSIKNGIT